MPASLSLNEIRSRSLAFAKEWEGEKSESAEKQSFWNDFFNVFGIHRRRFAAFEVPVSLRDGKHGKIDLFWPGLVLVEHKSAGQDLTAAFEQAAHYFAGIDDKDLPRYVIVSDFARIRVYDMDGGEPAEFPLAKLHAHIAAFGFLTGHTFRQYDEAPEVDIKAARLMGDLHEALLRNGYTGHPLAVLLVRLMFCFFADKTGIFQANLFRDIVERKTKEDGSDLGPLLTHLFAELDKPKNERQKNLDPDIAELEYVNGHLFEERFDSPAFDKASRVLLLRCASFDWSAVSPAIFGAMFQSVMEEERGKRRRIGAHYTSEKNILKAIGPALIDPLREEFNNATTERALNALLKNISQAKVLDPACGCGNFLVIAYRELRQIELDIHWRLMEMRKRTNQRYLSIAFIQGLNVDAMYGIEIEEFPCRVAETALYLVDHLVNNKASERFGENFRRLPLSKAPHITNGNALRLDWGNVVPASEVTAIVGNPPFIGKKARSAQQAEDMQLVFGQWSGSGELDYVSAWYVKALRYLKGTTVPVAFVSTNSLTQGEQVGILWPALLREGVKIQFAHRTFRWDNDAPGEASVYCVIIGWGLGEPRQRVLFDYDDPKGEPHFHVVNRINPYLVDFDNEFVSPRRKPLWPVPAISFGSMPNEAKPKDANTRGKAKAATSQPKYQLLLTSSDRDELLSVEPRAAKWIRRFYGSEEFINGIERWCLWMVGISPAELRAMPLVMKRVEIVKRNRLASKRAATRKLANAPWLFGEIRQPTKPYILIPRHSSEFRQYIPMAILTPDAIAGDACTVVLSDDLYHLGVLQSTMHMAWVRQVCGRLEARYRYSNEIVYNNFPWPESPTIKQQDRAREAMQSVLDARRAQKGQTLADLYDANVMPSALRKAHTSLDAAVDACYGKRSLNTELARVKFLFERYADKIAAGQKALKLSTAEESRRSRRKK